ncbi:type II toxin-antitoxin system RelE/ParE family toxin [Nigerium sp.]|uniref:type II toxin-antitoxin system RelE/ParE family toxin n=1 Tax=Nigerium sp. TaxID=2042655 RepID=UPI0032217006
MWEIETALLEDWIMSLPSDDYDLLFAALEVLSSEGPALGRPLVDTIKGSTVKNLKELRPGSSGRSEVRVLFAFDPARRAIMLVADDKAGNWQRWYRKNIPVAEQRYRDHLEELHRRQP